MKVYPYYDMDDKRFLLGVVSSAQLAQDVGTLLSELHRDKKGAKDE